MTLPNAERAIIEPAKVRDYLLSRHHPLGRFKADFFHALGYRAADWRALESHLRMQHLVLELSRTATTHFGTKYVLRGNLTGPIGRTAMVTSVWIVLWGEDVPRFVTAYPGEA